MEEQKENFQVDHGIVEMIGRMFLGSHFVVVLFIAR